MNNDIKEKCDDCTLNECDPDNCPLFTDTWIIVKEQNVIDEKTGLITRFTLESKITGEERYKYWNDLVKEMWEGDYPVQVLEP